MAATPKRARISALIAFSRYEDQNASEKLLHNIQLTLLWKTDQVILSKTNLTNFIGKIWSTLFFFFMNHWQVREFVDIEDWKIHPE